MENKNQFRVGVFLSLGIVSLCLVILFLGGEKLMFTSHILYRTELDQVTGLNIGSVVSLSGLSVGNVRTMEFKDQKLVVTFKVNEKFKNQISKNSTIDIRTQGALGDKFLYITAGNPGDAPLDPILPIPSVKSSDIFGMIAEKGAEAAKVFDIINEVYKFTKILNEDNRSLKMLNNLSETTQSLKLMSQDAREMMASLKAGTPKDVQESAKKLNQILSKIDRGEGTLGALINDPSLHEQLKSLLGSNAKKQSLKSLMRSTINENE